MIFPPVSNSCQKYGLPENKKTVKPDGAPRFVCVCQLLPAALQRHRPKGIPRLIGLVPPAPKTGTNEIMIVESIHDSLWFTVRRIAIRFMKPKLSVSNF
jgi:hypothetical protein